MKQQKLQISYLLLAALLGTSCSNENDPITPIDKTDAIELGITAGVSLTKSAVTAWTNDDKIAVFATGTDYTAAKNNDHAIYTYNLSWANGATDKIYLTHEVATIYAYYPSTLTKPTNTDNPVVAISVFKGDDTSDDSKYPTLASLDASTLITAPGEVDYMWAEDADNVGNQAQASNGKKTSVDDAVKLNMKHGLAMVSFNIYNDNTYKGAGKLTKIVLKNGSDNGLSKGSSTMALKNGTIAVNSPAAATYTRGFKDAEGYAISNNKSTALKFSFLVFPDNSSAAAFDKTKVQVVFTIDGADYPVALTAPSSDSGKWLAGNNYLYTAKLSGKELSITSVSIAGWTDKTGGELGVK